MRERFRTWKDARFHVQKWLGHILNDGFGRSRSYWTCGVAENSDWPVSNHGSSSMPAMGVRIAIILVFSLIAEVHLFILIRLLEFPSHFVSRLELEVSFYSSTYLMSQMKTIQMGGLKSEDLPPGQKTLVESFVASTIIRFLEFQQCIVEGQGPRKCNQIGTTQRSEANRKNSENFLHPPHGSQATKTQFQ
jgi:hypothetical protein